MRPISAVQVALAIARKLQSLEGEADGSNGVGRGLATLGARRRNLALRALFVRRF